ncbi:hypothetical protein [Clostridium hydrogeniformans]|uniref:hypothetical protein n=1 Tax=Clostridium hydrogeniformans TaxID=349933 RepID=UPI000ADC9445|nr:hypothetical protein [Clostridium hydrogeniformans]
MLDFEKLKLMDPLLREKFLKEYLGEEKCKVLDKYGLTLNNRLYYEKIEAKYPTQDYFSLKFASKATVLGMVFQVYRLCFAKTKYFENNWHNFYPSIYDLREGFKETELYNMEFITQYHTGITIDLRYLSTIHDIKIFKSLCSYLEEKQRESLENSENLLINA